MSCGADSRGAGNGSTELTGLSLTSIPKCGSDPWGLGGHFRLRTVTALHSIQSPRENQYAHLNSLSNNVREKVPACLEQLSYTLIFLFSPKG